MRFRLLVLPALCALVAPFAGQAHAGPYCVGLNWDDGDRCTFEAPAGEYGFSGIADQIQDGQRFPWVAVQVSFAGQVIASCYDQGTSTEPAHCVGIGRAVVGSLTHVCQVFGSGGPTFNCADPPPLPLPVR